MSAEKEKTDEKQTEILKTEKTEIPEAADTGTAGDTPQSGTGTENAAPQENTGDAGCVTGGFADLCRSAALTEKTEPPEKQETPDTGGNMPYDDPETAGQKSRKTGLETAAVYVTAFCVSAFVFALHMIFSH